MSVTDNMQYILATASGKHINLFCRRNHGIYLSVLGRRNRWSPFQLIVKNCLPWFSTCLDEGDNIHIAYQDLRGDIIHLAHKNGSWSKNQVLKAKTPVKYNKHMHITSDGKGAILFHVVQHSGKNLLSFQKIDKEGKGSSPQALDYIDPAGNTYGIFRNGSSIWAAFNRAADGKCMPGYRMIETNSVKIHDFNPLPSENRRVEAVMVDSQSVHLCIHRKPEPGALNAICHISRDNKSGIWSKETVFARDSSRFEAPGLMKSDEMLVCFWSHGDSIWGCVSSDGGRTWDTPVEYTTDRRNRTYISGYVNHITRTSYVSQFNRVPCVFSGGFRIILPNELKYNETGTKLSGENNIYRSLKDLQKKDEKVSDAIQDIKNEVKTLQKKLNKYSIELEKIKLKEASLRETAVRPSQVREEEHSVQHVENTEEPSDKNRPLMPGKGFDGITSDYLKNLGGDD